MTEPSEMDTITMRAIGFEWDEKAGGWVKRGKVPDRPGKAIRNALIDSGHIFPAEREARKN